MNLKFKSLLITLVFCGLFSNVTNAQDINKKGVQTLLVQIKAKSSNETKVIETLQANVHKAWTKSGNYKMELYSLKDTPTTFYLFERWQNQKEADDYTQTTSLMALQKTDLAVPIEYIFLDDLWPIDKVLKKETHQPHVTLMVNFEVQEGRGDALVSLFEKFVPLVRREHGNLEFHFHKVRGNKNHYILYERWANQADLDAHLVLPTTAQIVTDFKDILAKPVSQSILFVNDISREIK